MQGIIIDPVDVTAERDAEMAAQMGLKVTLLLNTHVHADHITGTGKLKTMIPGSRSVLSEVSGAQADIKISEGDEIRFGSRCDVFEHHASSSPRRMLEVSLHFISIITGQLSSERVKRRC